MFTEGIGSHSKEPGLYKADGKMLEGFPQVIGVMQFILLEISWPVCARCRTVVLGQRGSCPPGDIQQYMETFLLQSEGWW